MHLQNCSPLLEDMLEDMHEDMLEESVLAAAVQALNSAVLGFPQKQQEVSQICCLLGCRACSDGMPNHHQLCPAGARPLPATLC